MDGRAQQQCGAGVQVGTRLLPREPHTLAAWCDYDMLPPTEREELRCLRFGVPDDGDPRGRQHSIRAQCRRSNRRAFPSCATEEETGCTRYDAEWKVIDLSLLVQALSHKTYCRVSRTCRSSPNASRAFENLRCGRTALYARCLCLTSDASKARDSSSDASCSHCSTTSTSHRQLHGRGLQTLQYTLLFHQTRLLRILNSRLSPSACAVWRASR